MAERHGLRALQVRVAGHRRLCVLRCTLENRSRKRRERSIRLDARVGNIEPERGGDLIVARAAGLDLPPDLAELRLDERVHVFGRGVDRVETAECLLYLRELAVVEDSRSMQALGMQERALHVVRQQLGVVGLQELPHLGRELRAHPSRPERHAPSSGTWPWRSSIRRVSAMSLICTASCPIRSAAVKAVALRSMLKRSASYVTASPAVSRIV